MFCVFTTDHIKHRIIKIDCTEIWKKLFYIHIRQTQLAALEGPFQNF